MNFLDLGLSDKTVKAIEELGINEPTTVQNDVIPSILAGKDVFTIAPQCCGKTCSYVFPLLDIISKANENADITGPNILIITPDSQQSVAVSDQLAIFNKYHEINGATLKDNEENVDSEANVIIGSPDLLVELIESEKIDLSKTNILVVDDINLIKKRKQLANLEKILDILPADKQNIVYTNRRSKETQDILDKILKAPEEIKVDKNKEQEVQQVASTANNSASEQKLEVDGNSESCESKADKKTNEEPRVPQFQKFVQPVKDREAIELIKRFNTFNSKTPDFLTYKGMLVKD